MSEKKLQECLSEIQRTSEINLDDYIDYLLEDADGAERALFRYEEFV